MNLYSIDNLINSFPVGLGWALGPLPVDLHMWTLHHECPGLVCKGADLHGPSDGSETVMQA